MDEAAFARWGFMENAGQCCRNAAAPFVTHHHDFGNAELGHRKFQCRRDAVTSAIGFVGRDEIGNVPNDKDFTGVGVEDHRRVGAAIAAGDDDGPWALAFRKFGPSIACTGDLVGPETLVALKQVTETLHRAPHYFAAR